MAFRIGVYIILSLKCVLKQQTSRKKRNKMKESQMNNQQEGNRIGKSSSNRCLEHSCNHISHSNHISPNTDCNLGAWAMQCPIQKADGEKHVDRAHQRKKKCGFIAQQMIVQKGPHYGGRWPGSHPTDGTMISFLTAQRG